MHWKIDRKVSTITLDNCTTNETMLHHLSDKLSTKDLLLDGEVLHMQCFAHSLKLIMKDDLEIIGGAIEKIRDSVEYWTASPARIEKIEKVARHLHISCTQKLSLDCKTRWNSTYLMLETAIIYKDVFPRVQTRERHYKSLPTNEDWERAIDICGKLKTFYQITEMFSGTLYRASNFYFPKICGIKLKLDEWVKSPNTMIQNMAKKMLEKYEKYWDACHIMMGVAAVLDPRYKMKLVEFYLPLIYGDRSQSKIDEIRNKCYDLLLDYQSRSTISKGSSSCSGGFSMMSCVPGTSDALDFDEMFEQYVASNSVSTAKVTMRLELDMYLEENLLPRTPDFDVLSWWKTNGVKYPNLQKMARDILAIPVSTVASESAFSTSGRSFSSYQSKLHPDTLDTLMCSRSWLWNEAKGK
ncbi:UNVERIFIED_CONTAM: Zinc finger BED domain-containing protein RICESLEEPER 2 [Sesamum latifolium]|uniref:Zinc finger BED domain-containing protein RICESLEEPER 2 n=1 Tax=Sesamum latifolium TaxID=2727402 RepID=A0AAW2U0G6_9LAMI